MRVLTDADAAVSSPLFINDAEVATDTTGSPTCSVVNLAGTSLTAASVTTETAAGAYTAALLAGTHTVDLDVLTLTWTGTVSTKTRRMTDEVVVVGAHLAAVPDVQALTGVGSTTYSAAAIRKARDQFADIAEDYCGVSFVPRASKLAFSWRDVRSGRLLLDVAALRSVRSIEVDGAAVAASSYEVAGNFVDFDTVPTEGDVVVIVEHGLDNPPAPITEAALIYCESVLKRSTAGVTRDAWVTVQDGVSFRFSTPDKAAGRPTGYIDVDRLLNSVSHYRAEGIA